jgi:Putative restriction endonuclease
MNRPTTATTGTDELRRRYEESAEAYLRSLPPEHFMESTTQARQREITVTSMRQVRLSRPDIQTFNELLVQYPLPDGAEFGKVVPDNMVVVWPEPIAAEGSYDVELQPVGPTLVTEYVSKGSTRKDYDTNMVRYEQVGVPYYLIFYPDNDELSVFKLAAGGYRAVRPRDGRIPIPELELAVGLVDGWVRFWFRGELVPLIEECVPAMRAELSAKEAEIAALKAELARLKAG